MPTAVWTGTLSFGLVAIPVRLIPATEPQDIRFHLYDRAGRRVRQRRVVEEAPSGEPEAGDTEPSEGRSLEVAPAEDERSIAWEELMRGHETEEGDVILVAPEEIERIRPQRSRTIDIEDFVALEEIDPVHFEKTYVAVPQSAQATRPYVLLHRAMRQAGRVGIGRFVLRTKPHLVAVRPMQAVLAVETLFFGDEVRDPSALAPRLEGVEVDDRQLELAVRLIQELATVWDPAAYADEYREELLRVLSEKEPVARAAEAEAARPPPVTELMAALKQSVEASSKAKRRSG